MMQYRDIASAWRKYPSISFSQTIADAFSALATADTSERYLIVMKDDVPQGVLQEREAIRAFVFEGPSARVGDLRLEGLGRVSADSPVDLLDFQFAQVCAVFETDEQLLGYISQENVQKEFLQYTLKSLSASVKSFHLLGGRNHQRNAIFYEESYHSSQQLDKLLFSMKDNNTRFWKILKFSSDSIYVADSNGICIFGNLTFENSIGNLEEEFINAPTEELSRRGYFHPPLTPMVIREKKNVSIKQLGSGGTTWWVVTGVPIFDENGDLDMVVTNAKKIEEYKQLLSYVEQDNKKKFHMAAKDADKTVIYSSPHMESVMRLADKAAEVKSTVLITGESGVGKGVVTRYIHAQSDRCHKALLEVNCSSIPDSLFESEFFGYAVGAFTGAKEGGKPGLIELADHGTLLLDEISEVPLQLQAKLLHVLQDKKLLRIGGTVPIDVDVHIIAATNQSLEKLVEAGSFRADLFYRLNVFPIHIRPLRERPEEIPLLTRYYLHYYNNRYKKQVRISNEAIQQLQRWPWPGNVRQLESFIERLVILHSNVVDYGEIMKESVYLSNRLYIAREKENDPPVSVRQLLSLQEAQEEMERQLFLLAAEGGRSSYEVATLLGISQTNAYRKMKKYLG